MRPPRTTSRAGCATRRGRDDVRITAFERLPGGAIQDNWTLDVEIDGGPWHGTHALGAAHRRALRRRREPHARAGIRGAAGRARRRRDRAQAAVPVPRPSDASGAPSSSCSACAGSPRVIGSRARRCSFPTATRWPRRSARISRASTRSVRRSLRLADLRPPAADHARATIAEYRAISTASRTRIRRSSGGCGGARGTRRQPWDATLIHRDYRTGNYLVDGGRAHRACSTGNSPGGATRARTSAGSPRAAGASARTRKEAGGIAASRALPARLRERRRTAHRSRDELDYWQAMAHLRWAIIALQQAQRHVAGGERSLELALTGRIVHELEYELLQLIAGASR